MPLDRRGEHRAGGIRAGQGGEIEPAQQAFDRPRRRDLAVVHQHQGIGEADDGVDVVADIEDRQLQIVAQAFDERQDFVAPLGIEAGQRLVHQHEARIGEKGASDRHPLLLAARQRRRLAVEQMVDAEKSGDMLQHDRPRTRPVPIGQVLEHRHMGEQQRVLEHIAQAPPRHRHIHPGLGIEQGLAVHRDPTFIRLDQSGDHVDDGRFARAGLPEQGRDPLAGLEGDIDRDGTEGLLRLYIQRHGRTPRRCASRREMTSEAVSAAMARTSEMIIMRAAGHSLPGVWAKV